MRQAGRYMAEYRKLREKWSIKELSKTPELAAEVTMQPVRALGVDAAILFSDILLIAEPMGFDLNYTKGEGPSFSNPIKNATDIKRMKPVNAGEDLAFAAQAIKLIRGQLDSGVALIGFAGAPFTLASYLIEGGSSRDYLRTKSLMSSAPKSWNWLMQKLTLATADYLKLQIESGAQAVQIFDSWVGCLSPQDFNHFVLPYNKFLVQKLKPLGAPIIYFGTGTAGFLGEIKKIGADVFSVDWRVSLDRAWRDLGDNTAIQGNLDPSALFSPKAILKKQVQMILNAAQGRAGHIFNLGHGILPKTPVDHVRAVVQWIKRHNSQWVC